MPVLQMPEWMRAMAADPRHAAEAQQLWQEHQAFRAAYATPEEARAMKELFPGGASEAQALRQGAQAIDQIDAAIYSGDARAQAEVVSELARANPAAFRSLFAEAAKVLAGLGNNGNVVIPSAARNLSGGFGLAAENAQRDSSVAEPQARLTAAQSLPRNDNAFTSATRPTGNGLSEAAPNDNATTAAASFDAAAYAAFERATNDAVARDVRAAVSGTLARVLPEGVAEGAARRIGEDIFQEIHRTLAADPTLSEQVGEVLRARQFGAAEQMRVAQMLSGRAQQLLPSVARRVIGEWTGSVLGTARTRSARQAAAASRVDIAAPGGSMDSMPLRPLTPREVDYARMSDDDILSM